MRHRQLTTRIMALALAAATATTVTGCAGLLEDKGPLPPRHSGGKLPADTVVRELTSALGAEGITLDRAPQNEIVLECGERLSARADASTANADLRAGLARARSHDGWKNGREPGTGLIILRKADWTAVTQLPVTARTPDDGTPALIVISLTCDAARPKSGTGTASPSPSAS